MNKIKMILKNPKILFIVSSSRGMFNFLPDKYYLPLFYKIMSGERLNLQNPTTYNEKIQWLKLNDRNPLYTHLVDKYEVRKYIAKEIGEEYLIPLIGVWDTFDEIDFSTLPNQFILKSTHDSGGIIICKDKNTLNLKEVKKKLNKRLRRNYFYWGREFPYKNVKPRIICEKLMVDESGTDLKDYKIFCFSGEPKLIQVDYGRFTNHKRNFYDTEWNFRDVEIQYSNDPSVKIKKPEKLKEMLELAKVLSKDYLHVRVDFYSINNDIYFGEMTFYHGSGLEKFTPKEFGEEMGSWIKLENIKNSLLRN